MALKQTQLFLLATQATLLEDLRMSIRQSFTFTHFTVIYAVTCQHHPSVYIGQRFSLDKKKIDTNLILNNDNRQTFRLPEHINTDLQVTISKKKKSKQDTTGANLAWNKEKVKEAGITEEEKD